MIKMTPKWFLNTMLTVTLLNIFDVTLGTQISPHNTTLMWTSASPNKVLADSGLTGLAQLPALNP